MRKIMLLMSIICLTAMAAGCEDNNMVVLMCDGGACPEGSGSAGLNDSEPAKPDTQDSTKPVEPEKPGPGTQDPTQTEKPGAQDPSQPGKPEDPDNPTGPEIPTGPDMPHEPGNGSETGGIGDACGTNTDCNNDLVCQSGVCGIEEPEPKCDEGAACVGCECHAPMECKNDVCVNSPSNPEPSGCEGNGKCDDIEECVNYKCVDRCSDKVCMAEQLCAHNYLVGNYVSSDCEGKLNHLDLVCNNNSLGWGVCAFDRNYWECKKEGSNYSWERDECGVGKRCVEVRYYMGILGAILSGSDINKVTVRCIDQK